MNTNASSNDEKVGERRGGSSDVPAGENEDTKKKGDLDNNETNKVERGRCRIPLLARRADPGLGNMVAARMGLPSSHRKDSGIDGFEENIVPEQVEAARVESLVVLAPVAHRVEVANSFGNDNNQRGYGFEDSPEEIAVLPNDNSIEKKSVSGSTISSHSGTIPAPVPCSERRTSSPGKDNSERAVYQTTTVSTIAIDSQPGSYAHSQIPKWVVVNNDQVENEILLHNTSDGLISAYLVSASGNGDLAPAESDSLNSSRTGITQQQKQHIGVLWVLVLVVTSITAIYFLNVFLRSQLGPSMAASEPASLPPSSLSTSIRHGEYHFAQAKTHPTLVHDSSD